MQRGEPGPLRIPLIPTNQRCDFSGLRIECAKPKISGREIEFLVIRGIVRNMHLAINTCDFSVSIYNRGGVVVDASSAPLEQRCDYDRLRFLCDAAEGVGRGTRHGFSEIEISSIFALAKILRLKKLGQ